MFAVIVRFKLVQDNRKVIRINTIRIQDDVVFKNNFVDSCKNDRLCNRLIIIIKFCESQWLLVIIEVLSIINFANLVRDVIDQGINDRFSLVLFHLAPLVTLGLLKRFPEIASID